MSERQLLTPPIIIREMAFIAHKLCGRGTVDFERLLEWKIMPMGEVEIWFNGSLLTRVSRDWRAQSLDRLSQAILTLPAVEMAAHYIPMEDFGNQLR